MDDGEADAILDLVEARALRDVLEDRVAPKSAPEDLHHMAKRLRAPR